MGERRGLYRDLVGKTEGKRPLGRPSVDGRIILSGIWGHGLNLAGFGQGQLAGTCKCCSDHSGSITCGELLD